MIKTVLKMSLIKIHMTINLRVLILWTLMMKMLRIKLRLVTSLNEISEKKRKRGYLVILKKMVN